LFFTIFIEGLKKPQGFNQEAYLDFLIFHQSDNIVTVIVVSIEELSINSSTVGDAQVTENSVFVLSLSLAHPTTNNTKNSATNILVFIRKSLRKVA